MRHHRIGPMILARSKKDAIEFPCRRSANDGWVPCWVLHFASSSSVGCAQRSHNQTGASALAALKKTEETLAQLYGVLSDDQKKIADTIVLGSMGMPMGMM